jgi:hypothetical protein
MKMSAITAPRSQRKQGTARSDAVLPEAPPTTPKVNASPKATASGRSARSPHPFLQAATVKAISRINSIVFPFHTDKRHVLENLA